ncbi:hypothetical protein LV89_04675 [Arcicella aurantiaca]|uniref:Uncharacterized protein n=1 Tax=Arcicella aurantiaca TaxID=591202 RepID=A0A316DG14_9BACT|nr:hypothetical protein [Arcicella aurantiaca]PWK16855.1 hypothetical protein LV89_04675 [Arcicella aurantiaca]
MAKINFLEIKLEIDRIVDKANWGNANDSFNWKTYTEELDNDAWMGINFITEEITELSFRADLREPNLVFLNRILELANKNEMMLMDIKGNVFKPELKEVGEFIKISNCYRFLEKPKKFIDDLLSERGQ